MPKLWIASMILATHVAVTEILVRNAIREHPVYYCLAAVCFALFGGCVIQYGLWSEGKATARKASSELMFSVLTGVVAFLAAASRGFDEYILYGAALLGGMAGRRTALMVKELGYLALRQAAANLLGVRVPDNQGRVEDPPP
jgi:hypothetical protein